MNSDPSIDNANPDLQQVQARICDLMLLASAILTVPALAASLFRITTIGWQWVMAGHIFGAVLFWILLAFKTSIPYRVRAGAIVGTYLFIGLAGFWQVGLIAGANPMLLVAPIMATVLFGKRLGIIFTVSMVLVMVITAYSFIYGGRAMPIEFALQNPFIPAWITYLLVVVLAVGTSIAAITMSNHHLASALVNSRNSQSELIALNQDLESQVAERTLDLESAKKTAEHQARTDVLTGLNNRRAFFECADSIDAQSRRYHHTYVIAMIDIDHFKMVNDKWGHDTGDTALLVVARALADVLRDSDILGRIGGEEFAVILPETSLEEAQTLAERLRKAIENAVIPVEDTHIPLTISIGLAAFDDTNDTLANVISNSDTALYCAKSDGRNTIKLHEEKRSVA